MFVTLLSVFADSRFLPHGYCLQWDPWLLWSLVGSHIAIGLSYYSIPVALLIFIRRHRNLKFNWVFALFGLFIFACGTTHLISTLNIWWPVYRLDASVNVVTAAISAATAIALWPLLPRASAFLDAHARAQADLQAANQHLNESLALLEQRQSQIEQSERRFRLTLETAPIGCAIVGLDGRWIMVNQALCTMLGYSEKELLKLKYQDLTHPDDVEGERAETRKLLDGGAESFHIEKRYIVKQGREIHTQLDVAILRDEQDQPLHFITQIQDISARKRIDVELQSSKTQLESGLASLAQQNRDMTLLGMLSGIIQACHTLDEIAAPIARFGRELFPGYGGALYLRRGTAELLESVAEWNGPLSSTDSLTYDECWALRRGLPHRGDDQDGLRCAHLSKHDSGVELICVPMSAQGENIGLLYLQAASGVERPESHYDSRLEKLSTMVVDRLGIALANIRLRQTLEQETVRDPLTRLYNRRYLAESLPRELSRAERENLSLAVLMFDVDHFKNFNDTYGHELGDQVLRMIGETLLALFRGSDIVCRYGGEEFAVILMRTSLRQAMIKAEQLRVKVRGLQLSYRHRPVGQVTISIGVACYPQQGSTADHLLAAADEALYAAKHAGRDRVAAPLENPLPDPAEEP